jgi:hypothetical protein
MWRRDRAVGPAWHGEVSSSVPKEVQWTTGGLARNQKPRRMLPLFHRIFILDLLSEWNIGFYDRNSADGSPEPGGARESGFRMEGSGVSRRVGERTV